MENDNELFEIIWVKMGYDKNDKRKEDYKKIIQKAIKDELDLIDKEFGYVNSLDECLEKMPEIKKRFK